MHVSIRVSVVVLLAGALGAGLTAQQQLVVSTDSGPGGLPNLPGLTSSATPLAAGTGLIYGQAVDGQSTKAVSGVLVTLAVPGSIPVRVLADGDGHFTFRDVPKGSFSITASKPGYSDGAYGRLRPEGPTQALALGDGQRATDVTLPLWKLSSIAGTVVDDSGEPLVGATVQVLKRTIVGGKRQWQTGPAVATDDRGMYRVGSLVAGEYVVVLPMAAPTPLAALLKGLDLPGLPGGGGGGGLSINAAFSSTGGGTTRIQTFGGSSSLGPAGLTDDGHELWYETTFYPTALSSARADIIRLRSGEEHGAVDFTMKAVPTVKVAGTLVGPAGPMTQTTVTLVPADAGDLVTPIETATAQTDGSGHFEFTRVPAGAYALRAVKAPRSAVAGGDTQTFQMGGNTMVFRSIVRITGDTVPPLPTEPTLWMDTPVTVGTTDVADLAFTLRPGVRVSGRIEFVGASQQPTPDQYPTIGVSLLPADGRPGALQARGRVEPSGSFTTVGVPAGKYVLRIDAPNGWLLRGATVGGHDISDGAVDLHDADVESVVVTFTDKKSSLTGTVTTAAGSPDGKATVILFPQDPTLWVDSGPSPRKLKSTRPGADGSYTLAIPAGDYLLIAVSDTGAFEWNDPQFLASLVGSATHVSVNEGDTHQQPLRTIAPPTISGGV